MLKQTLLPRRSLCKTRAADTELVSFVVYGTFILQLIVQEPVPSVIASLAPSHSRTFSTPHALRMSVMMSHTAPDHTFHLDIIVFGCR